MQSRVARPAKPSASQKSETQRGEAPSTATTFARSLRLLNFDLLPDWPHITEDVFSPKQNLQVRVKAVEWSLYRLFEIYDPKDTQTKLRPFFPPVAPLQSLNLRAALYRALTELKKNGILGRDVVLRKTMLDECKGEKFEEVISTFALLVLRKTCRSLYPGFDLEQTDSLPKEYLVQLIFAYKRSLQQGLQERQTISQNAVSYASRLAAMQHDLQCRHEGTQEDFQPVSEEDLANFSGVVKNMWTGDSRWCEVLLQGPTKPLGSFPNDSCESSAIAHADGRLQPDTKSNSLAAELEERIAEQERRLKKWKTFHGSLTNLQRSESYGSMTHNAPESSKIQFDQHKELRFDSQQLRESNQENLEPYHASILKKMESELERLTISVASNSAISKMSTEDVHTFVIAGETKQPENHQPEIEASDEPKLERWRSTPQSNAATVIEALKTKFNSSFKIDQFSSMPSSPLGSSMASAVEAGPSFSQPEIDLLENRYPKSDDKQLLPPLPDLPNRQGTLMERTRQSMSLLPNPPSTSTKQSLPAGMRVLETPAKSVQTGAAWLPRSGSSTPRDRLFSEEADYASVFKSRPRIAVSPSLSPERSQFGADSLRVDKMDDLTLENEEDRPSRGLSAR